MRKRKSQIGSKPHNRHEPAPWISHKDRSTVELRSDAVAFMELLVLGIQSLAKLTSRCLSRSIFKQLNEIKMGEDESELNHSIASP